MQPSAQESKTVPFFTTCGGKRQWCQGSPEHIAPSYPWQSDVKASVYKAWQISPNCRLLVEGAFVLDQTKRIHDKPQGRIVLRVARESSRAASDDNGVKVDTNLAAMVPQKHSEEGGRHTATSKQNSTRRYALKKPT